MFHSILHNTVVIIHVFLIHNILSLFIYPSTNWSIAEVTLKVSCMKIWTNELDSCIPVVIHQVAPIKNHQTDQSVIQKIIIFEF